MLRQRRLGEADKICVLFTPERGRIEAVAKGVRRPKSKLAGHVEPLTQTRLLLAQGRSLDIITQAETLQPFAHLHDELERLSRGLYVAELLDRFTDAATDVGGLYPLLLATLERLEEAESVDLPVRWFEMRLLMLEGYQPQLDACVQCSAGLEPEGNAFSAASGGVLCPSCRASAPGRPLSGNAFRLLRYLQRAPYAEVARVRVEADLGRELETHLRAAITAALDQEVRTPAFVDAVRALPGARSRIRRTGE